jgi:hypothetical protein
MDLRMPKILTASWSTKLPTGAVPVGISRGTPRRRGGYRRLRALEPGIWFRTVPPARYIELYRDILDRLDPAEIYDQLLSYGDCPVMLCWESASDCHSGRAWCHRHLAALWLESRLGIEVREVGYPNLDRFAFLRKHGLPAPTFRDNTSPAANSFR